MRWRLYAIRKVHGLLHLPDPTHHKDINLTLRRVRRSKRSRPRKAKSLTRNYLEAFLASEPDTPTGMRNCAIMSLGYDLLTPAFGTGCAAGRRRRAVAKRDLPLPHPPLEIRPLRYGQACRLLIEIGRPPRGVARLARRQDDLALLPDLRRCRFRPRPQSGHRAPRDQSSCVKLSRAPQAIEAFSGHSMRIGAAQDLLGRGLDIVGIMRACGWKTVNVIGRYL